MNDTDHRDFFISYTGSDQAWAEWIAWHLEAEGHSSVIQAWDFRPGSNFVLEMDRGSRIADHTIIVLSKAFVAAFYTQPEWAAAFAKDPRGQSKRLIPVRVESVHPEGLLSQVVYIDLVGKDEEAARVTLLRGIAGERTKPITPPSFPGQPETPAIPRPLTFPGAQVSVPSQLSPYVENFRKDHGDARRTAFLIMQFGSDLAHSFLRESIVKVLNDHGITVVRADDKSYAPDLMTNVRTYLHGCAFGIAVFEGKQGDAVNPNVALEVGYLLALGKPVCFLKDRSLPRLATDLVGFLYSDFDPHHPEAGVRSGLTRWLEHMGLANSTDENSQQPAAGDAGKPRA